MMNLWVQSYTRQSSIAPVVALSAGVHLAIIAAWIIVTLPTPGIPMSAIYNRPVYMPPPNKIPSGGGPREVVHFVALGDHGPGAGDGPRAMGNTRPITADETVGPGERDTLRTEPPPPAAGQQDSVFTVVEVDSAVVRMENSAAPEYPLKLLQARVVGWVAARYVVDTTGLADPASFVVLDATHPEFVAAVRDALPRMRFQPAKIGMLKVRQLVEQKFSFTISDTSTVVLTGTRPYPVGHSVF
jgi:hypothetical protein